MTELSGEPLPPSLPPKRGNAIIAWVVIIAAVAASLFFNYGLKEVQETKSAASLDLLKLQSLIMIGLDKIPGQDVPSQLGMLEKSFQADREKQALAALRLFLEPENTEAALALIDPDKPLGSNLVTAISNPDQLSAEETDSIQANLGWFGEMMLSAHDPESEKHQEISAASFKAIVIYLGILGGGGLACLIGLTLLIFAWVRFNSGQFPLRFENEHQYSTLLLEGFAVYMATFVGLQLFGEVSSVNLPMAVNVGLMLACVGAGMLWPVLRGLPKGELLRLLGLHRGEGVLKEIGAGLVGYVAMIPLFVAGVFMTMILQFIQQAMGINAPPPSHPIVSWISNGNIWIILFSFVLAAIGAPLMEETMFRGAFYRGLRRSWGIIVAGLVMGFIFAIVHPQGIIAIPPLMLLGFGFGLLREWRDSLIGPMIAHGFHNGALVLIMSVLL